MRYRPWSWSWTCTADAGIRLGTAAVTTQGMEEGDMARIAALFGAAVREPGDVSPIAAEVRELVLRNPPYPG
ncbi:hypothetical protein SMICM17S_09278 [Streptomyces microflavus]